MNPRPDHGETSYKGSGRLKGRSALITGGDSGMGRAAAMAFAREGAEVAINYLPAEEPDARALARFIRAEGRKAVTIPGDIKDEVFCKRLVADAARELGGLDILVNNAARQIAQESILDISTAQFDETFKTNVYAMFWITKAVIPVFKPGSTIINTASVNAYDPDKGIIDYAASKGAIMIFTKGLGKQLASKEIRVNAVAPGPFWTPRQVTGGKKPEEIPVFGQDTPLGRPTNQPNWHVYMCYWPLQRPVMQQGKSMVRLVGMAAHKLDLWIFVLFGQISDSTNISRNFRYLGSI